jgi:hypothetical protein
MSRLWRDCSSVKYRRDICLPRALHVGRPSFRSPRPRSGQAGQAASLPSLRLDSGQATSLPSSPRLPFGDAQDKRRASGTGRTGLRPLGASTHFWDRTLVRISHQKSARRRHSGFGASATAASGLEASPGRKRQRLAPSHFGFAPFDPAPFDLAQDGQDRQHRRRSVVRDAGWSGLGGAARMVSAGSGLLTLCGQPRVTVADAWTLGV